MSREAMTATASRAVQTRLLGLLLLAYVFNFLDRQILSILAIPIAADLNLNKEQMGLMGGIAFASLYSTLAIPFARYADRGRRVFTISTAVAVWSAFTALCGAATSFWQLFLARMGVGIGEAGGVAPSYALIADTVPRERQARALAIFSLGIPIGSAIGLILGGWLAATFDWRLAFVVIGLAGLPLAWAVRRFVPEPARPAEKDREQPSFGAVFSLLARKPAFWFLSFGAACASICGYGLAFWFPTFFTETLGVGLADIGWMLGLVVLVGGTAGIWGGGWLGDRLGAVRPGAYPLVPALAFLLTAPIYWTAISLDGLPAVLALLAIGYALSLTWLGPVVHSVQTLVPAEMRATASAAMLLINNLIGIGFGTYFFGWLAVRLEPHLGDAALRWSMISGLCFYLLAALLMLLAARRLGKDMNPT